MRKKLLALALTLALVATLCPTVLAASFIWPLDASHKTITSLFGERDRPIPGASTNHKAVDIAASYGDSVYAAAAGTVRIGNNTCTHNYGKSSSCGCPGLGNYLYIDHSNGQTTIYGHLGSISVSNKQTVKQGDVIGKAGSTGTSTGCHLHFAMDVNGQRVDPLNYVDIPGTSPNTSSTTANGPSTLKISPTTEPGENMPQGQPFYFKGKITSNYPITTATISILPAAGGKALQAKTITPNTTTVDIATSGLDALKFGQLSPGKYRFQLSVWDSKSTQPKEWYADFSIAGSTSATTTPATSTLTISPTTEPGENMPQGQPFYFKGKITSNYVIHSATISINSADGLTNYQSKTVTPNTTSVDIATSGLDALKFGQLAPGNYLFHLVVNDKSGKVENYKKKFSIAGSTPAPATPAPATPAPAASTLTISPINKPGQTMKLGEAFEFTAKLTSNYNITSAQLDIREEGKTGVKQAHALSIDPNKKEVNYSTKGLSGIQFERLLAGSYRLYLTVKDSSGATKQWEQAFSIVDPTPKTYNVNIYGYIDGQPSFTRNVTAQDGESFAFDLSGPDIPTLVVLESGFWDESYRLYFTDVHSDINAHVYYETAQEAPAPTTAPTPTPTSEPTTTPKSTSTGNSSNFHSVNTYYSGTFYDVSSSDWFGENVKRAYELGLMKGMSDNVFDPNSSVTVAQAVTLAARLHSIYHTGSENFVQSGNNWYDVYVSYAQSNGILRGLDFDYTIPISRQSFAYILAASMPKEALPDISDGTIQFGDEDMFDSRMASSVYQLAEAGIIRGIPNVYGGMDFAPYDNITRAQVAAIVTRMADPSLRQ